MQIMRITMMVFFCCLLVFALPVAAGEINDIRMAKHMDKTRVVVDMTDAMDFNVTTAENPKRLVIHFPVKNWKIGGQTNLVPPFTSVQHAISNNRGGQLSQISLNMDGAHNIRNAYVLPAGGDHSYHRLVVDVAAVTEIMFKAELGKTHGTLAIPTIDHGHATLDSLVQSIARNNNHTAQHNDALPTPAAKPAKQKPYRKPIIVIDPGHGGQDPGAISPGGIQEKHITLPMAKNIARILNNSGRYDARLTRTKDIYIKLHNRVQIARNANADLFISIHADAVTNHKTHGASIYTLSDKASDSQTAKLAARENRSDIIAGVNLEVEDPDVSMILLDLSMRETMNQSKHLANTVVQTLGSAKIKTLNRPHRYAGFAVLKAPDVPSVLIETGFVSNEAEARRLLTPSHQKKIAETILKSLDRYFADKQ